MQTGTRASRLAAAGRKQWKDEEGPTDRPSGRKKGGDRGTEGRREGGQITPPPPTDAAVRCKGCSLGAKIHQQIIVGRRSGLLDCDSYPHFYLYNCFFTKRNPFSPMSDVRSPLPFESPPRINALRSSNFLHTSGRKEGKREDKHERRAGGQWIDAAEGRERREEAIHKGRPHREGGGG